MSDPYTEKPKVSGYLLVAVIAWTGTAQNQMPKCVRPTDFSNGKFVASYEACLNRQENFCETHREDPACLEKPKTGKPYYKTTTDEIDPSIRCKIEKDDSYKCLQDPIRIIVADDQKPSPAAPATTNSTAPAPTPKSSGAPPDEGAPGDEKTPQVVIPPPPPH